MLSSNRQLSKRAICTELIDYSDNNIWLLGVLPVPTLRELTKLRSETVRQTLRANRSDQDIYTG